MVQWHYLTTPGEVEIVDKGGKSFTTRIGEQCPDKELEVSRAFVAAAEPYFVIEEWRRNAVDPARHT